MSGTSRGPGWVAGSAPPPRVPPLPRWSGRTEALAWECIGLVLAGRDVILACYSEERASEVMDEMRRVMGRES